MTRFRLLVIAIVAILCGINADAARQNTSEIRGSVCDKNTGEPLGWVTVALMKADSTLVSGTTCDDKGIYSLQAAPGEYILKASLIGYSDFSKTVTVVAGLNEIEPLNMSEDTQMLSGATVTERVKLVEMKIDKLVMNVSQSAFAQGSNALELIKKAPGVMIDKDGKVTLNGKAVHIWIDGRPSYLDGKGLEALLRSTSGSSIEKFELMEHPSAKYDAEGQGGIINIKTKRNLMSGLNGEISTDDGGMYFGSTDRFLMRESLNGNISYRTAKTNTFVSAYQGIYDMDIDLDIDNKLTQNGIPFEIRAKSLQRDRFSNWQVRFGNDWFIDKKNTLGFIVNLPGSRNVQKSDRDNNVTTQTLGDKEIERAESTTWNEDKSRQTNGNLNFTHIFDEATNSELTLNMDYYHNANTTANDQKTFTRSLAASEWVPSTRLVDSDNKVNIWSAKADYEATVFNFARLEAGAKWAFSKTANTTSRTETGPSAVNTDTRFKYRENIGAAYFSLAAQFGPKWSAKAGLRGEYTNSLGDWITAGDQSKRSYFDLFPTAFVGFNPSAALRFSVSYTRRIQRPSYNTLNPVEYFVDAHTYTVGDPDLRPSYSDEASFMAGFGQHFSVSTSFSHSSGLFSQLPTLKENGDQLLTWANFGRQNMLALTANMTELPLAKWLVWTLNCTGLYSDAYTTGLSENETFTLSCYSCFTFNLPKDWKVQLDGYYRSPMAYGYFKLHDLYSMNIGMRKTMLDGRLTLSVNLDDVLRSLNTNLDCLGFGSDTVLGNVDSSFIGQKYYSQMLHIGLSWRFGKAQQARSRKVGNIDEASRIGTGSGLGGK